MNAYRKLQAENHRLQEALAVAERGIRDLQAYALSDKYREYPADPGIAPADVVHRCVYLGFEISEALDKALYPVPREHRCLSCGVVWGCAGCEQHDRKSCSSRHPDGYWSTCDDCRKGGGA